MPRTAKEESTLHSNSVSNSSSNSSSNSDRNGNHNSNSSSTGNCNGDVCVCVMGSWSERGREREKEIMMESRVTYLWESRWWKSDMGYALSGAKMSTCRKI